MKIVAASDLHLNSDCRTALLQQAKHADLIIVAGDFAQRREGLAEFLAPFEQIAAKSLFVPGNNETVEELRQATSARVLHGEGCTWSGLHVFGIGSAIPPLPPLPWGSADLTEAQAQDMVRDVAVADIIISHSPPKGHCDFHARLGRNLGSETLLQLVERLQPQFFFCGHVHDSWGARSRIGATCVANLGPVPVLFEVTG